MTQHDLSEQDYLHAAEWATYEGYSDAERVALEYCEKFATDHVSIDQELIDRLVGHYSEELLVDMTLCIGSWVAFGRMVQVMGAEVSCPVRLDGSPRHGPEARAARAG